MKRQGISRGGWDNPIGLGHRLLILTIISKSSASGNGITITEISRETRLTRQTVYSLVKELLETGRITKTRKRYFVPDNMVDDYWTTLAYYLEYLLIMSSVSGFRIDPIQKNWLNSEGDDIEGTLYKIANRIGAFITFVLIEAMRPSKKIMSPIERTTKSLNFIKSSISLDYLFRTFINMLPDALSKDIVQGAQLRKASHDRLSSAFRYVYPSIYKSIREGLDEYSHTFTIRQ